MQATTTNQPSSLGSYNPAGTVRRPVTHRLPGSRGYHNQRPTRPWEV